MNKLSRFKSMHDQEELLFLPNAWDVLSAIILEQVGFKAIGTTSWGIARSMGYEDGQKIKFDDLLSLVKKIISAIEIPITVDVEAGYSDSKTVVAENILKIADLGVTGINIEDSLKGSKSGLINKEKQCELLAMIRNTLDINGYNDFFINARIDTYLQKKNPLNETIERAVDYVTSGADGVFVPGLCQSNDIVKVVNSVNAPLNVMSLPNLTDSKSLNEMGVKRFSLGFSFSDATIAYIEETSQNLFTEQSTKALYAGRKISTSFRE